MKYLFIAISLLVTQFSYSQIKLTKNCAKKDMMEKFKMYNERDVRWNGDYTKGMVVAAYNTNVTLRSAATLPVDLAPNSVYRVGIIESSKDRRGASPARTTFDYEVYGQGFSWSNPEKQSGYIITGDKPTRITVSVTGGKYYDLRDTEYGEPLCLIIFVDKLSN